MIDQDTEYKYNVMLSIFLGIFVVLIIWNVFTKPREVEMRKITIDDPRDRPVYLPNLWWDGIWEK